MFKAIRTNIFVGLILVTPLVITAFVANWLFTVITNQFVGLFPRAYRESDLEFLFRIAALLLVIVVLFFVGLLVRNILGRKLYQFGDRVLTRIPVINGIYVAIRQVIDAFLTQRETLFNQVVLIEYPRKGLFSVGFLTATAPHSFRKHIPAGGPGDEFVAVFIPTTPNPTSGWICFVPREDVHPLPYSSGDTMKMIISAGVVYPEDAGSAPPPSLVEKLHNLIRKESGKPDKQSLP
ncbi:MAG TPA: DUF502 domain-containing protein [Kiritimatiellia bacterium]|nr:DUF502 domain-containing protein [Kiritimatiellia bacterium]HMP34348.1 DUF502 domain-containing protein [Kiritimatiellia bacterium]